MRLINNILLTCLLKVSLALWGSQAEEFDGSVQPVLAIKNGRINEFGGGKSVSLLQSSVFQINPDITEAHKLRGWFDNVGSTQEQESISSRTGIAGGGKFLIIFVFITVLYFLSKSLVTFIQPCVMAYKKSAGHVLQQHITDHFIEE